MQLSATLPALRWLGRTVEVLVERAEDGEVTGRTRQNRVIIGAAPLGALVLGGSS